MSEIHEHCCIVHGCKYSDDRCPVADGTKPQSYRCGCCDYEKIDPTKDARRRVSVRRTLRKHGFTVETVEGEVFIRADDMLTDEFTANWMRFTAEWAFNK